MMGFAYRLRRGIKLGAAVMAALAIFGASESEAASRGLSVTLRAGERADSPMAGRVKLYDSSHALVIGIDRYTAGWPDLKMAVADARAVADELEQRGFEVTLKLNVTARELSEALKEFFVIQGAEMNARLLLWYAGHGQTIDGEGFLVPADAPPATDPTFKVKALHLRDFEGLVRLADAKHVMSIFDSCFAGTIFSARAGAAPASITRKTILPVRQFQTSGDAGQLVRDDGSFREHFLRAIRGGERADVNGDGYVTGDELALFLSQSMTALTEAAQTPLAGRLHDIRFNQGDFVFALPEGARPPAMPGSGGGEAGLVFWRSIQGSKDPELFKAYLGQFPKGTFAPLARKKLKRLAAPRTDEETPYRPWFAATAATYRGEMTNPVRLAPDKVLTRLTWSNGELTGVYTVFETTGETHGTLDNFKSSGRGRGLFRWRDRYGEGGLRVTFSKYLKTFHAEWNVAGKPGQGGTWSGRR